MEDIGSGHAALLIANYPIMTLHTPLVSISSYPITAQHRWLKSPESAVAPFFRNWQLVVRRFSSRAVLFFGCVVGCFPSFAFVFWLPGCFCPFRVLCCFSPLCAVPLGCFGDGCAFHLGWAVAVAFRPGVTIARSGSSQLIFHAFGFNFCVWGCSRIYSLSWIWCYLYLLSTDALPALSSIL